MKIGIIGFGHLGKAFTSGLLLKNILPAEDIQISARTPSTMESARYVYGVNAHQDVNKLVQASDIIFLSVKNEAFDGMAQAISPELLKGKILVSFIAGISKQTLQ